MRLRHLRGEAKEEVLQEIVADTLVAYVRMFELGKEALAYPTPLVNYALAKFRAGRRVGGRLNIRDVMSVRCQRRKGVIVERLDRFNDRSGEWHEMLVEDRHASPAELAIIRIDFFNWLKTLTPRNRRIAEKLATGETTSRVARMFAVSAGRIAQLRKEMRASWDLFTGELAPAI
jgi:hypothetical protein